MIRWQIHMQLKLGHFRQFYSLWQKLEELTKAKGLVPSQLWVQQTGAINAVVVVQDYETLEAYDRDGVAFESDPELQDLWRATGEHTEGIPWIELWRSAHEIA